jgi:hypothetical protein
MPFHHRIPERAFIVHRFSERECLWLHTVDAERPSNLWKDLTPAEDIAIKPLA